MTVFQRECSSMLVPKPITFNENEPFAYISIVTVYLRKIYLHNRRQVCFCVCRDSLWENP
jgi:hypothetical protein